MFEKATSVLQGSTDYRPWGTVDRTRFFGLVALAIGLSQALVALGLVGERPLAMFPVGAGGWLFVAIGINLLQGRSPFHSDWHEDGRHGWIAMTVMALVTVLIVAAAILSLIAG